MAGGVDVLTAVLAVLYRRLRTGNHFSNGFPGPPAPFEFKTMKTRTLFASCCVTFCFAAAVRAEVKPSTLFSDHAVLQSGMAVPVWGTADPGEKVVVTFAGQTKPAVAGADGKWMVRLAKLKAGGPFEMTIAGKKAGETPIVVKDVLVGEVWVGSGQSNMVFNVSRKGHAPYGLMDEEKEIAAANYPQVRMFTVKDTKSYTPEADAVGEWKVCSPETAPDFSAVGYLFARDLNQALKTPVGVILSAYGASTAEAWIPRETMAADPQLKPLLDGFDARETFFKNNPGVTDDKAPVAPQTLNARPGRPGPLRDPVQDQHQPTVLYNGMINPILPYAIRGAIWYQGESIVGGKTGVTLYPHVMETMVTEWRKRWGEGNFPFYAVQLAALKNASNNPMVREQQAAILSLPNSGIAITIDIGDPANVHPKNKEPLGDRLTRIALANAYGRKMEYSGPMYASMKVEGAAIRVKFTHAQGLKAAPTPNELVGLYPDKPVAPAPRPAATPDGPRTPVVTPLVVSSTPDPATLADAAHLHWFQIAGADGKFVDAEAKIDGDSVVVSSPQVTAPTAVRYAWDNYPAGANLYNGDGLPAAPFRTDKADALTPISAEFTGK
jgi:sialate O-acetylesterase